MPEHESLTASPSSVETRSADAGGAVPSLLDDTAQRSDVPMGIPSDIPSDIPRGEPTGVTMPEIGVDATLVPVGLRSDQAMEVPAFGLAGWYAEGPRPGRPGPSVIVGHVDSYSGPDVFHRLSELVAGDRVRVVYDSGDSVDFVVLRSERIAKDELPVASIWPHTDDRLLALITCGGTFDRSSRTYEDNIVVYATTLDRMRA